MTHTALHSLDCEGRLQRGKKARRTNKTRARRTRPRNNKKRIEQDLTLEDQGRYVVSDCEFVGPVPGGWDRFEGKLQHRHMVLETCITTILEGKSKVFVLSFKRNNRRAKNAIVL